MPLIGLDIRYGTPQHNKIVDAVRARWQLCKDRSSHKYDRWQESEEQFLTYLPLSEADRLRKEKRKEGKPSYVTIEIPYSYSQLLAAHTYDAAVFLGRSPIHQFSGRHVQTEDAVTALEAVIDYQATVGQLIQSYYVWLMDRRKYGCGIVGTYWDEEYAYVSQFIDKPATWAGMALPLAKPKRVKETKKVKTYDGNRVYNIRPYDFIFDPRVTLSNFQKGEFAGVYREVGWNTIAKKEESKEFINVDVLAKTKPSNWWRERGTSQMEIPNRENASDPMTASVDSTDPTKNLAVVELCEMVIELIPKDWKLGLSSSPEKWLFVVGNDKVLLLARPLGLLHNKFPFAVGEMEIEGYGLFKRSMLEILRPYNDVMTWLINTHFHNIRKALNDQLVFDPSRITVTDLKNGEEGRLIRMKEAAYGTDWRQAIGQLQVGDVTQAHMRDLPIMMDMAQKIVGVNDNFMGSLNSGGRKTATEVRQSNTGAMGRLKTEAEFFSVQGFGPMAQMLVQQSQQFYQGDQFFRIAGSLMNSRSQRLVQVTPDMIAGAYDFIPVDGTLPIDRFAQAALWKDIMTTMAGIPPLMMQFDLGAVFEHVAQLGGIKNLAGFKLQITDQDKLNAQIQAGNVIPMGGKGGRKGGGATTSAQGGPSGTQSVAPVSGMGPPG